VDYFALQKPVRRKDARVAKKTINQFCPESIFAHAMRPYSCITSKGKFTAVLPIAREWRVDNYSLRLLQSQRDSIIFLCDRCVFAVNNPNARAETTCPVPAG
jgi:hypothetical protein